MIQILALAVVLAGCGSKRDDAPPANGGKPGAAKPAADGALGGACDRRAKEKLCGEYRGGFAKPERIKEECAAQQVPYLADGCPKEDAVGRCTRGRGTASQTDTVFYAPNTRETVAALCSDGIVGDP